MAAGLLAESITSNFTFTSKVPLLMKATSNDEKPTQGYDLQEITNISKSSLPNCKSLLNFLLGRLEKKSPYIKYKVLNLMKYLVINGHSEFRSGLRHNAEMVKEMTTLHGELDPIHGDGLNRNVCEAATKLELLLFDVNNPEVEVMYQSMVAPNQTGKKMEGFGNSITPPIKKDKSLSDFLKIVKDSVPEMMKLNTRKSYEKPAFQPLHTMHYTPVRLSTGLDDHHKLENTKDFGDSVNYDEDNSKTCEEDIHYYEKRIVQNITAKEGIRNTPSKEMLKEFVNKSSSLDFQVILEILDGKLRDPSEIVQLKSLCVLEYLLRCDLPNIFSSTNNYCGYINTLTTSHDPVIQAKANKISLTISSAMRLQQVDTKGQEDQLCTPPSYEAAKDVPNMKTNEQNEKKDPIKLGSLFSGMNFSVTHSSDDVKYVTTVTRQQEIIPDLLVEITEGTHPTSGNLVDIFDPLASFGGSEERTVNSVTWGTTEPNINTSENNTEVRQNNAQEINGELVSTFGQVNASTIDLLTDLQPSLPTARVHHGSMLPNTNASSATRPFPKDMKPHEDGFAFLRKSSKKDAFSFVGDEIAASKTNKK